jgi:anti-sigma regulatory factor (Ser/Thr protein kinase)
MVGEGSLRRIVTNLATDFGLDKARTNDLVASVNELATNSLRHAGGRGTFRVWPEQDAIVAEISDRGHIGEPLVGGKAPPPTQEGGLGLWIINKLCDLVQMRSNPTGSVVRIRVLRR